MPGNKEKANLKLQISNIENEFMDAMGVVETYELIAEEKFEKLEHLKKKLKALEKKPGKNKAKKSQK